MPEGQNGVFWDLGCGSGKLVVAAATLHPFTQVSHHEERSDEL